ncbi:N-carbamoylputrescine amidase [bacterium]|nr:N-carbamoylputrescine amidase [bacterium]
MACPLTNSHWKPSLRFFRAARSLAFPHRSCSVAAALSTASLSNNPNRELLVANKTRFAAIQCTLSDDLTQNAEKVASFVEKAAKEGANIVLPSELFQGYYFCKEEREEFFARALPAAEHPLITRFQKLARSLNVVIPVSFFEREGQAHYNSIAIVDATGDVLGVYRKSHIPDGPGYEEKYYFNPGNTGFRVWDTKHGRLGVAICWDQWFPECARAMALQGAQALLYPTAIGSEPALADPFATKDRWQRAMIGHAVSNVIPVIAANRTGSEGKEHFYGHSFIADETGVKVAELESDKEGVIYADFDFAAQQAARAAWGFFRDRRPELYKALTTQDGRI